MRSPSYDLLHPGGTAAAPHPLYLQTFFAVLLAFAGLSLQSQAAHAQTPAFRLSRITTGGLPNLQLYLTYLAADGSAIKGRAAADFKLVVDSEEQDVATALTLFENVKEPISLVTITQVSGALREPILTEVKAGFRRLAQTVSLNPAGRVSVLTYASSTKLLLEGGGAPAVEGALAKLGVDAAGGEVQLLAALRTAINLLKAQPEGRRKLIVVVSDGSDSNPEKRGFLDLGNLAQQAGIVIDTIGYNELDPDKLRNLQELSKRCYGVARVAKSAIEVGTQLSAVVEELQKQYVATFRLSIAGDDKEHIFQVFDGSASKPVYSNVILMKLPAYNVQQAPSRGTPPQAPATRLVIPVT